MTELQTRKGTYPKNLSHYKANPFFDSVKDIVAGSIGGVGQCLVGHPFDTVKVRLQTQVDGKYKGMIHGFRTIIKEESVFGLFKGVQSPLAGLSIMNAVCFLAYGRAKEICADEDGKLTIPRYFLAGGLAGVAISFVESPFDFFKCQLQVRYKEYTGLFNAATKISKNYGIRGVYQGLGATLLRDVPANALYFGIYEWCRHLMCKPGQRPEQLPAWKILLAGGAGGLGYWALTYPADVIKSTMQADTPVRDQRKYKTIMSTAKQIWQQNGVGGFFKGFTPCITRAFPANAVTFLLYEWSKRILNSF